MHLIDNGYEFYYIFLFTVSQRISTFCLMFCEFCYVIFLFNMFFVILSKVVLLLMLLCSFI